MCACACRTYLLESFEAGKIARREEKKIVGRGRGIVGGGEGEERRVGGNTAGKVIFLYIGVKYDESPLGQ